jgi:hypothetical protein
VIAAAVSAARNKVQTSTTVGLSAGSVVVPFGPTNLNATLERFNNCTSGGPLDICAICMVRGPCGMRVFLGSDRRAHRCCAAI